MATTTLYPNGDGTISGTVGGIAGPPYYVNVDEGTASPDDNDFISMTSVASIFLLLTDLPSDASVITAVTVKLRTQNSSKGRAISSFQLLQSDESTALIAQTTVTGTTTFTTYSFTPTITGATTKAAWDGARLKINSTGSTGIASLSACQVEVTYSITSGATYTSSIMMTF